jgi:hypothetical protein
LNSEGISEWQKEYSCLCNIVDVVETSNGFTAAGTVDFIDESYIVMLRVNKGGDLVWSKKYRRNRFDTVHSLIRTRDGGYLIGAFIRPRSASRRDARMWLIKIGATGSIQWQRLYNVARPNSMAQLSNGDILVGTELFSVLKLTATGNFKWQKKYFVERCCDSGVMESYPDGGFALAGDSFLLNGSHRVVVIRADSSGEIIFSKSYNKQRLADFRSTSDGGFIILTGRSSPKLQISLVKLDALGNVQWRKISTEGELNIPGQIRQTADGGYVYLHPVEWIVKLDSLGNAPDLCRNIFTSIQSTAQNITVNNESRTPSVVPAHAVPVVENFTSEIVTPIRNSICGQ